MEFPLLGFGTYKLQDATLLLSLKSAIDTGYTMLDTAELYRNESEIGAFLKTHATNKPLWITTKVQYKTMLKGETAIRKYLDTMLETLKSPVDLCLIHAPNKNDILTWQVMREYQEAGQIRHLGVSNYTLEQLQNFVKRIPDGTVFCNQIEFGVFLHACRKEILEFCREQGIRVVAYGMLNGLGHPVLKSLANACGCTVAQLLLAWCIQQGITVLPSSTNPDHICENAGALSVVISASVQQALDTLNAEKGLNEICRYPRFL